MIARLRSVSVNEDAMSFFVTIVCGRGSFFVVIESSLARGTGESAREVARGGGGGKGRVGARRETWLNFRRTIDAVGGVRPEW